MVNRHYRFVRWVRATMTAVLVPLLVVTSLPACATLTHRAYMRRAPARAQWSRVEAVPVGTRTDVALFEDEAPPDSRRITGRFRSATADSLSVSNSSSGRRWKLDHAPAVGDPTHMVEFGTGRRAFAREA